MRLVLKKAMENIPYVELVFEAGNGTEALNLAVSHTPDVVFMDIDLPDKSGIEVSKDILNVNPEIFLIFATGHSEYMH